MKFKIIEEHKSNNATPIIVKKGEKIKVGERSDGTVLEDYSAKELEVEKDEIVEGNKELNGWVWCSKLSGMEEGWLPKEKIIVLR